MNEQEAKVELVRSFVALINRRNTDALVLLADEQIELVGPRGSGFGRQLLRDWMGRANLSLDTFDAFARGDAFVLSQHGVWHTPTGEVTGEEDTFMHLRVGGEPLRVMLFSRYTTLEEALAKSGLDKGDRIAF